MNKVCTTVLVLFIISSHAGYAKEVVYAAGETTKYYSKLLNHALSYSPKKLYTVKRYNKALPKQRSFNLLKEGTEVDVMNGTSTSSREKNFTAIRFPILRGLKGWRLAIINQNTPQILANVNSLKQLKKLNPVQFHTWTAAKILTHNGITVATAATFKGLFQMIDKKRVDYLPRSILEIKRDLTLYPELQLKLDPHIVIRYPNAYYFYVNKNNQELAADILTGLEKSLNDGSFDDIFDQEFGETLRSFDLTSRKIIDLNNPFLLDSVPVNRKELWAEHFLRKIHAQ